jgi:hypothetical protein
MCQWKLWVARKKRRAPVSNSTADSCGASYVTTLVSVPLLSMDATIGLPSSTALLSTRGTAGGTVKWHKGRLDHAEAGRARGWSCLSTNMPRGALSDTEDSEVHCELSADVPPRRKRAVASYGT